MSLQGGGVSKEGRKAHERSRVRYPLGPNHDDLLVRYDDVVDSDGKVANLEGWPLQPLRANPLYWAAPIAEDWVKHEGVPRELQQDRGVPEPCELKPSCRGALDGVPCRGDRHGLKRAKVIWRWRRGGSNGPPPSKKILEPRHPSSWEVFWVVHEGSAIDSFLAFRDPGRLREAAADQQLVAWQVFVLARIVDGPR